MQRGSEYLLSLSCVAVVQRNYQRVSAMPSDIAELAFAGRGEMVIEPRL